MAVTCVDRPALVMLAGVKHELYHASLPTFRKMDMDNVTCKLSHEHSRTTTQCSRDAFSTARSTILPPKEILHCKSILSKDTGTAVRAYQPLQTSYTETWKATLEILKNLSDTTDTPRITGLSLRSKHPAITSAWQNFDPMRLSRSTTPRLPASMYSRHRATRRPATAIPWK